MLRGLGLTVVACFVIAVHGQAQSAWQGNHFPLDLTPFYSQSFSNLPAARPWNLVPRGWQTLDGVPFHIGGKLEVAGLDAARHGDLLAARVTGIPVRQRAARLQVLHGAAHGQRDGTPMSKLVLQFANGETRSLRLAYGLHARNWMREPGEPLAHPRDPNSHLAWSASGTADDALTGSLRFYRTPLDNPLPEIEITSLEVVSLFSKATPMVFAVTLEKSGPALWPVTEATAGKAAERAFQFDDAAYLRDIVVQATEADGAAPLTNASVHLTVSDSDTSLAFAEARTDRQGRAVLSYPVQNTVQLGVQVRAPGHVPETLVKSALEPGGIPREFRVRLERGARIGGAVEDDLGAPIAGAQVWVYRTTQAGPAEFTQTAFDSAVTDREGRWASTGVPRDFRGFRFELGHRDFKPATYFQASDVASNSLEVASQDLREGRAVMRMAPHIHVFGVVVDTRGQVVKDAQVLFRTGPLAGRAGGGSRQTARTDGQGQFDLALSARAEGALGISAPGLAPEYRAVAVGPGARPLRIVLGPGSPLRFRVRDQEGAPVPEAMVSLSSWNNVRLVSWSGRTDTEGRLAWTNAPLGGLAFSIYANDYSSSYPAVSSPAEREIEVTLRRSSRVSGTVRDARTGTAVESAWVTPGHRAGSGDWIRWIPGYQMRVRKGGFSLPFNQEPPGEALVRVEAPGYLPALLGPFTKASAYTNEVKLQRGSGLSGVVLTPSGAPATKAGLVLLEAGERVQMDSPLQFRRSSAVGTHDSADREGRFEFPARLAPRAVLAAHAAGFAVLPAAEVAATGRIQLQRWGCVRGVVQLGSLSPASVYVALHGPDQGFGDATFERVGTHSTASLISKEKTGTRWNASLPGSGAPVAMVHQGDLTLLLRTRPAPRGGSFFFDKVPPGAWRVSLLHHYRDGPGERLPFSHGVPVTVESGKTNEVILGGPGRTVTGRVQVTGGDPEDVDWTRDVHCLALQVPGAPEFNPPDLSRAKTSTERQRLQKEFDERARAFQASEPGRALARTQRSYALVFASNGVFRADAVPPGSYELILAPTDQTRDDQTGELLGFLRRNVVVSEGPTNEPLDLGVIPLAIRPVVRVGEPAPAVTLKTFDGQPVRLEDHRGKFVLLDFWDTATETRSADLENLQSLESEATNATGLVIVSLNLDRDFRIAEAYARANPMPGPLCHLGPWTETKVPAGFGLDTNAAAVVVLDPAGRIASKPVRSEYLRSTVRRLLKPPR